MVERRELGSDAAAGSANVTNHTTYVHKPTAFGSSASYTLGYRYTMQALFTFIPLLLLLAFNTLLIRQVQLGLSTP